ncbi:TolC family outer membrane protein [Kushneria phyllosphaerae]|uniref:Outer membrane efflux protein BepC n=1 Tax=Kushneria phyllosphaerae TaxID=2100822 RepID=A0A2R8CM39_9GAMM|nr:TolC family outer membrane protein [Kushneria phyllosphaerae]SPJ33970.1 Outer membrane efflux protein BepC [Kushneria phyllosphaerae]
MKKWLAGCLVLSLTGAAQAQSLDDAVTQAIMENPITRTEVARYEQFRDDARAQRGAWLPSVDLEARAGRGSNDSEVNGLDRNSDVHDYRRGSITLSQLIWDNNRTLERVRNADNQVDYQRWEVAAAANRLGLATIETYLDVLQTQRLIELAERNVDTHQRIAADIRRRSELGAGTATDASQVDGRLARAEASLIAAYNNREDAISSFVRLVGEPPRDLAPPQEVDLAVVPDDIDAALAMANEHNPILVAARRSVTAAGHEVGAERADFLPELRFQASRLASRDYDFEGSRSSDWNADLVMSWNLYRGGIDVAEMRARQHSLEAVQYDSDRALREVRDELRLAWNARDYVSSQLPYLARHMSASEQTRVNYRKQFDIGRRTLLDVLDSETELYGAQQDQLQARFALIRAQYRLLAVTGNLLDTLQIYIDPEDVEGNQLLGTGSSAQGDAT